MPLLGVELVDLGSFVGLGLATLFIALVVAGLTGWLRARERRDDAERHYYPGL